jgi:nucleoside-diphosphate-sugar epimerase
VDSLPHDLDGVIHTAGLVQSFNKQEFYQVNAYSCEKFILRLAKKYLQIRFVLISSMAVLGPSREGLEMTEDVSPNPVSDYGRSKLKGAKALMELAPESWKKIIIRPPVVMGPGDLAFLNIYKMIKKGLILQSGKNKKLSFVNIYDLVEVINKTLDRRQIDPKAEIYHPAYHSHLTIEQLMREISTVLGRKPILTLTLPDKSLRPLALMFKLINSLTSFSFELTPDKVNEITPHAWLLSSYKTRNDLDMDFKFGLEETVSETYRDYRQRGWI